MALLQPNLSPHPDASIATAPQKPQQLLQCCSLTRGTLPKHWGRDLLNYVYLQTRRSCYTPTENLHQLSKWLLCKSLMNRLLMAAIEHWSNPNKDANSGSALRASSALGEALKALGHLARGMSERPRTRWGKIQSPTPAACRVQNGVEWQHFAARRFLGTYSLFGKVSCAFLFFLLIWNLALQRKG